MAIPNSYDATEPNSSPTAAYELSGVTKQFGNGRTQVHALRDVSLTVETGEFALIVGPSGSGKSTLLQLLGGLDRPTSGTIIFQGRDLSRLSDRELTMVRRRSIGFIFQQFNLIPTLTARGNVEAAMAPSRLGRSELSERAIQLLTRVGLANRAHHLPSQMSGGEQQRVAIARALGNDPAVLLADEPTGNLDSTTGREILELLRDLALDEGRTVLMITHDSGLVKESSRVVHIHDGRIDGERHHGLEVMS